jgi:hypothetical protein
MKAKELRVGNYLNSDGVVVTIDGRSIFDIWTDEHLKIPTKYKPIELTPEWLFKFGFKATARTYFLSEDETLEPDDMCFCIENEDSEFNKGGENGNPHYWYYMGPRTGDVMITYVHELQNLYFVLTSEELTIK